MFKSDNSDLLYNMCVSVFTFLNRMFIVLCKKLIYTCNIMKGMLWYHIFQVKTKGIESSKVMCESPLSMFGKDFLSGVQQDAPNSSHTENIDKERMIVSSTKNLRNIGSLTTKNISQLNKSSIYLPTTFSLNF